MRGDERGRRVINFNPFWCLNHFQPYYGQLLQIEPLVKWSTDVHVRTCSASSILVGHFHPFVYTSSRTKRVKMLCLLAGVYIPDRHLCAPS